MLENIVITAANILEKLTLAAVVFFVVFSIILFIIHTIVRWLRGY